MTANADPTVLPIAEYSFQADELVDDAIGQTMQWGVKKLIQAGECPDGLTVDNVSKVVLEGANGVYSRMYRLMACVVNDRAEELKATTLPPPTIMEVSQLS